MPGTVMHRPPRNANLNTPANFTTSNPIVNTLIHQNNQLKLNLQQQQAIRAERDALLAELSTARQGENYANDQISQLEQEQKVSPGHNYSVSAISHAIDADQPSISLAAPHFTVEDMAQLERGNSDRYQLIQWHLNEIAAAKE